MNEQPLLYSKIEGQGEPLVILHGFLGMSDNWKTLGTKFAASGYEVHMLDMRNHGRSFHSDAFSYNDMAGDISKYCEHHQLTGINLLGHSMGGKAAMFFAAANPQAVKKLVIADIAPKYYSPHHEDILNGLNAVDFSKTPDRGEVEDAIKPFVPDFGTRQFLMKSLYWAAPGQLAFRFNLDVFNRTQEVIGEALPQNAIFEKPTLFLKGENSHYIDEEDFEDIEHHFPNSDVVVIPKAGHWLHAENPDTFYEAVMNFLK
ncbi:MAG TPA: alpha/beta fold hydrolase [Flavobacterium sp.]|jgi:pimeloyl-ACP methyl ester carboxylesterase